MAIEVMTEIDSRSMKGMDIAEKKTIFENSNDSFSVPSQSVEEIAYLVRVIDGKFVCNSLDFKQRHAFEGFKFCKHGWAVSIWIASQTYLQEKPKPNIFADDAFQCPKCASIRVIKFGTSNGKQAFKCKDCSHRFRETNLLKHSKYSPEVISLTLDLCLSGLSLRKIKRTVNDQFDMNLGSTSIYRWIQSDGQKNEIPSSLKAFDLER